MKEMLDSENETLKFPKNEYGEEVCNDVTVALLESSRLEGRRLKKSNIEDGNVRMKRRNLIAKNLEMDCLRFDIEEMEHKENSVSKIHGVNSSSFDIQIDKTSDAFI
ncbi:hypothetical protein Q3G72_024532 [Acer saccharum]|nr:hypothetical protein Q3G72_024532 [Acer saccharum]